MTTGRPDADHIRSLFPQRVTLPSDPRHGTVTLVEWGLVLPLALTGGSLDLPAPPRPLGRGSTVVDAAGHARPHYPGLLCYCWSLAASVLEATNASLAREWRSWSSDSGAGLDAAMPRCAACRFAAVDGSAICAAAWSALAATALRGRDESGVFGELLHRQDPAGPFLRATSSDNPETYWYHELVLLHAVASYGMLTGDPGASSAAQRHAAWVQDEAQPDHATGEPWGLHAFVTNPSTHPLADQVLHTIRVLHPAGSTGVSLMLLADALYCLSTGGRNLRSETRPTPP